ncbi:Alpha/Beta hydrolase protein [Hypoxylon sp. FL0543]|nr:Alpha/Beta hydrolase protein [Hypoxylon sp. FL0543]
MDKTTESEPQSMPYATIITHRSDLSLLYRILRAVIRPLRPRLVAPKREYAAGSPRLQNHPRKIHGVTITEREVLVSPDLSSQSAPIYGSATESESLWVYDFRPQDGNQEPGQGTHTVYYFPGGGFQSPAASEHWKFCAYLASRLPRSRVVLVSYPLAPSSPASTTLPLLRRWLTQTLEDTAAGNGVVSLTGDSSGANIALSLGLWCADQLATTKSGPGEDRRSYLRCLRSILASSPPTDMNNSNPAIAEADARDPVLGKRVADGAAEAWSTGSDKRDPYLSPKLADLGNMRATGVEINGVLGTADVLAPDALEFAERCRGEGVRGNWLVWEGQMHCFPLTACYGLREGREARDWVVKVLQEVV